MHRIGHLIVLPPGINSRAGTSRFADKVAIYKEVGGMHHVRKIVKLKNWDLSAIERREKELLKFAHEQWW